MGSRSPRDSESSPSPLTTHEQRAATLRALQGSTEGSAFSVEDLLAERRREAELEAAKEAQYMTDGSRQPGARGS